LRRETLLGVHMQFSFSNLPRKQQLAAVAVFVILGVFALSRLRTRHPAPTSNEDSAGTTGATTIADEASSPESSNSSSLPEPPPLPCTPGAPPETGNNDDLRGLPSVAKIGPEGGTLTSCDGRLRATIPGGALPAPTDITILPVMAKAPGALGSDYRLLPAGQTFSKPVNLTFRYSPEEAGANVPDLMQVATREANEQWRAVPATRDDTHHTLTVSSTHFSDWSYVGGLQMTPASATVEVRGGEGFRVIFCGDASAANGSNTAAVLMNCNPPASALHLTRFSVNGVPGGNAVFGRVGHQSVIENSQPYEMVIYQAPPSIPPQNPVAISVEVETGRGKQVLVSMAKIVERIPKYWGRFSGKMKIPFGGYHMLNAELFLKYERRDADLAFGDRRFVGTATASVIAKPIGCKASSSVIRAHAELVIHGVDVQSSTSGTYDISLGDTAKMSFECGEPAQTMTLDYPAFVASCPARYPSGAFGNSIPPGYELSALFDSKTCTLADGAQATGNWALDSLITEPASVPALF
jgi:hypothetical protein